MDAARRHERRRFLSWKISYLALWFSSLSVPASLPVSMRSEALPAPMSANSHKQNLTQKRMNKGLRRFYHEYIDVDFNIYRGCHRRTLNTLSGRVPFCGHFLQNIPAHKISDFPI